MLERVANSFAFGLVLIGGLLLHVFSRIYGLPALWQSLMGDNYMRSVSRVSEEGIELMAYGIIFLGIVELALLSRGVAHKCQRVPVGEEQQEEQLAEAVPFA